MSHLTHSPRPSVSTVRPVDRLQQIWSQLSVADREVILGHGEEALSVEDHVRLAKILQALRLKQR